MTENLTEEMKEISLMTLSLPIFFPNMIEYCSRFVHHLTEEMKEILRSSGVKLPLLAPIHHGQVIIVRIKAIVKSSVNTPWPGKKAIKVKTIPKSKS